MLKTRHTIQQASESHPTGIASPGLVCRRTLGGFLWLTVWWSLLVASQAATPAARSEYELKAAFLHKFAMFIEWPAATFATTNAPIVIGILGKDPFGAKLERVLANKQVHGRALEFQRYASVEEALPARCQILFITPSEKGRLGEILEALKAVPTLTVGDTPGYEESGVMINLVERDQSLRFEIDHQAATRAGLQISSQLLDLALTVRERSKPKPL